MALGKGKGAPPFGKKGGKKVSKPVSRSPMKGRC